jgi:Mg2+/citrate symporter
MMTQLTNLFVGILILLLGIPIGNYLAKETKEELRQGQFWFKIIIILSLIGVLVSLLFRNDVLLFTFAFISIVTSRSLKKKR